MRTAVKLVTVLAPELVWGGSLPAIVPSAGAELLTDPGLEVWTDASNLTNWSKVTNGTTSLNREATTIHGGTFAARMAGDASNSQVDINQTVVNALGDFIQMTFWSKIQTSGAFSMTLSNVVPGPTLTLTTSYAQYLTILRATAANQKVEPKRSDVVSQNWYLDDGSAKILAAASLIATRQMAQANGIFTNHPTRTSGTQAGIVHYADANNWVRAYEDGTGKITLVKRVAGTETVVLAATAITYSAGAALTLQRSGAPGAGSYVITYNGAAVSTAQSITDAVFDTAKQWGNFSTYSTNTFGAQSWTGPH